ncbi:MAG: FtsX-like permease family protein [Balneolaceae bacterium]
MKLELHLARRYFKGKRQGSRFLSFVKIIAIGGIAVGAAGLLISLSIVHGFKAAIEEKVHGFAPDITVQSTATGSLSQADTLSQHLLGMDDILRATPVVSGEVMIQSRSDISGTLLKGVQPDNGDVTDLRSYIREGAYQLQQGDRELPPILLGQPLARSLRAEIGDRITLFTVDGIPGPLHSPEIVQFELTGIYETGIERFDGAFALAPIDPVRRLFRMESHHATAVELKTVDPDRIEDVRQRLDRELPFPLLAESIFQQHRNIFAWIDLQEQTIPLVISVMVIIAAFNLIGTLLIMVLERTRDIGILKTMGARNRVIRRIFMLEGLMVALAGLALGIGIAVLFNWIQATWQVIPLSQQNYYMTHAPVEPHMIDFLIVSVVTLALSLIASWFPARVASRTDPIRVLSFHN